MLKVFCFFLVTDNNKYVDSLLEIVTYFLKAKLCLHKVECGLRWPAGAGGAGEVGVMGKGGHLGLVTKLTMMAEKQNVKMSPLLRAAVWLSR